MDAHNPLGSPDAESDKRMLDVAFLPTQEFKRILESRHSILIVGRRGSGKSALALKCREIWEDDNRLLPITISPSQDRAPTLANKIGEVEADYTARKHVSAVVWRYILLMESLKAFRQHYKVRQMPRIGELNALFTRHKYGADFPYEQKAIRTIDAFNSETGKTLSSANVSYFVDHSEIPLAADLLKACQQESSRKLRITVDRLDDGWKNSADSAPWVAGLHSAAFMMSSNWTIVFSYVRDNVFRRIAVDDEDFSREIEGHVIRLHWDESGLFSLVTNRIVAAQKFGGEESSNELSATQIWQRFATGPLGSKSGFRELLKHTLYRPRDLLVLLNRAYEQAGSSGRVSTENVIKVAKATSKTRFNDLLKEYSRHIGGLEYYLTFFRHAAAKWKVADFSQKFDIHMSESEDAGALQDYASRSYKPAAVVESLYSIGFLGILLVDERKYLFCYDGSVANIDPIGPATEILVHPCFWPELEIVEDDFGPEVAERVSDEHLDVLGELDRIVVVSREQGSKGKKIQQLQKVLREMKRGKENSSDFEDFLETFVSFAFATELTSVHQQSSAAELRSRRDVVAFNRGKSDFWRNLSVRFECTMVLFDAKNYNEADSSDFDQLNQYMSGQYGRACFLVNRSGSDTPGHNEQGLIKKIFKDHGKLIFVLTQGNIKKILDKCRTPDGGGARIDDLMIDLYVSHLRYCEEKITGKSVRRRIKELKEKSVDSTQP